MITINYCVYENTKYASITSYDEIKRLIGYWGKEELFWKERCL